MPNDLYPSASHHTLIDVLQLRASKQPQQAAYRFISGHHSLQQELTYGKLHNDIRHLAAQLRRVCKPGDRALLVYPPGLNVVVAFWACLSAGIVAVPAPGPDVLRPKRGMERLLTILRDAETSIVLTTEEWKSTFFAQRLSQCEELVCLATETLLIEESPQQVEYRPQSEGIAYLQYTSGSTSEPRGVVVTHRALLAHCVSLQKAVGWDEASRSLTWLPYFHDYGLIHGIVVPLYAGMPGYLMSARQFLRNPLNWPLAISQHRITHSGAPNFAYNMCARIKPVEGALDLRCWRAATCGAEPVHADSLYAFANTFSSAGFSEAAFMPAYGLAEHVLAVTVARGIEVKRVDAESLEQGRIVEARGGKNARTFVSCGHPIEGTDVLIVDPASHVPCEEGRVGEIWVSGSSAGNTYWNKDEITKQVFHACLASQEGPYLRTGDLGFMDGGRLFVSGRLKDLIIVGGRNYYPQDIERTVEEAHPAFRPGCGAAFSHDVEAEERVVIVQEVVRGTDAREIERIAVAVRRAVWEAHGLPVFAVVLIRAGTLLKTSSGKVQRRRCRQAWLMKELSLVGESVMHSSVGRPSSNRAGVDLEETLQEIFASVVPVATMGRDDNFFEWGGDSIQATQVMLRVSHAVGRQLPLRLLFDHPTISGLVAEIRRRLREDAPENSMQVLTSAARDHAVRLPLSFSQQRMWFMQQLVPDGAAYNMPVALRLRGPLNHHALEQALKELVHRHEILRTTFHASTAGPEQTIQQHGLSKWETCDFRLVAPDERERAVVQYLDAEARRPFDLSQGPPFRCVLIQIADDDHIAFMNMHHIIGDQWSYGLIGQEFADLYNGYCRRHVRPAPVKPPLQYADYVVWQRHCQTDSHLAPHALYWRQKLANLPVLSVPTDFPRTSLQRYIGSYRSLPLSETLLDAFTRLCAEQSATIFMGFLAAFAALLSRYTGLTDIPLGVPIANRTQVAAEGIVGTFVNTIVVRNDLSGSPTFVEFLQRVRETCLEAFEHQDFPFERLVDELRPQRDLSHSPLVQVLFNVVNAPIGSFQFDGLSWSPVEFDRGAAQFDLTMTIDPELTKKVTLEFRTDLFAADTIDRMLTHYHTLVQGIVRSPHRSIKEYRLLPDAERRALLHAWNQTESPYPSDRAVTDLIAAQAARTPDAIALSVGAEKLTYQTVTSQVDQLAHFLVDQGIKRGDVVGVALDQTPRNVICLLAVMKAGAAYLPLDLTYPRDRLCYTVEDSGCSAIVTSSDLPDVCADGRLKTFYIDLIQEAMPATRATSLPLLSPSDLAYVLYTSGSTGRPKGVEISHQSLTNFLWSMRMRPGFTAQDRLLSVTSAAFDIAALEFFLPLIAGGQAELVDRCVASDGERLYRRMVEFEPTVMQATPSTWRMLIEAGWKKSPGLTVLCGGEALTTDLAEQILARADHLWNMYGPTETTIWSTVAKIERGQSEITIGLPIANTRVYVLDEAMEPVPAGVPGELYIGGHGVARGYHNRPELTRERFIPSPFANGMDSDRLYKTGDLVKYRRDGHLIYLGRQDFQVKVRGVRVELGEVEAALASHPEVKQAVADARRTSSGDITLVGYMVAKEQHRPGVEELKAHLRLKLPESMIPTRYVWLDTIPLTLNGKVDRAQLPNPPDQVQLSAPPREPAGAVELQLAILWQETLGLSSVGRDDDFFELGGHSLKAVQLFAKMEEVFGKRLPLATLFQAPTIAKLAQILCSSDSVSAWQSLVAIRVGGRAAPIFAVPGIGGNVLMFRQLAQLLGIDQPFYGLQTPGLDGRQAPLKSIHALAAHFLREVEAAHRTGPYVIAGTCTGGVIAYEMAQQLTARGKTVVLILMETWHPFSYSPFVLRLRRRFRPFLRAWTLAVPFWASLQGLPWSDRVKVGVGKVQNIFRRREAGGRLFRDDVVRDKIAQATLEAVANYQPRPLFAQLLNVTSSRRPLHQRTTDTRRWWDRLSSTSEHYAIPAKDSGQLFVSPYVEMLSAKLQEYLSASVKRTDVDRTMTERHKKTGSY